MSYQLGIDLGTTYTAAAVCRSSDRRWVEPEVVTLGTRNATVPSVLFLAPDGGVVVGEAAERRALTDSDRVVREFKRRIGDPTPIVVGGRPWAPEELSARLVRWVVDRVAEREGGPAVSIAVTHPASWGVHKKELLARALGGQGLTVTFLAEPQAAALHYAAAERVAPGSTIAVYDLGGGTFDAAVVRKGDSGASGFGLLGRPEGLERLGGIDFDEAVFEHVVQGMPQAFAGLDDTDPEVLAAVARVRRDCTEAKEALSSDTEVSIPVMLPGARGSVRLHRSEFEALIRPRVEETVTALRAAIVSAGTSPDDLTAVLLVGGSSRIPLVGQLVSEQLGRPVAVDADPKNAIAKGAALSVSPKPTASWPGVAIPPVAAAAGAVAGTLASAAAPPAPAPPRPAVGPGAPGPHTPPGGRVPSGPPPNRPGGPGGTQP
ncbi:Hsp70 family protein, partial [Pseudonocardia humida]